jgi:hypothetical protein
MGFPLFSERLTTALLNLIVFFFSMGRHTDLDFKKKEQRKNKIIELHIFIFIFDKIGNKRSEAMLILVET